MTAEFSTGLAPLLPARVLIAVDGSLASQQAIAYARNLVPTDGKVRFVSVADNPHTLVPAGRLVADALESAREELLQDAADALRNAQDAFAQCKVKIETEVIDLSKHGGNVASALIDAAISWNADLLVVGARQHHGMLRWIEGTVSEPLAKRSRCPLLVVPERSKPNPDRLPARILFALDCSPPSLEALHYGVRFATHETNLHAIYVIDRAVRLTDLVPIDALEDAFVEEGTSALAAGKPFLESVSERVSTALVKTERTGDDVAHAIVRAAESWHAELIVMGTHGRRAMTRWVLGSVAQRVAQLTRVPLLLVHAHRDAHDE